MMNGKDTGALLTLVLKKLWKQIGQLKLEKKNAGLKPLTNIKRLTWVFSFRSWFCNKQLSVNIAVVNADKNFSLLGLDILNHSEKTISRFFKAEVIENLPTVKGAKTSKKMKHCAIWRGTERTVAT